MKYIVEHFKVAEEIWECDNGTVTKWPGDIISYKQNLISTLDDKIVMGKSADNRTQRAEPVQQKAPPPKVSSSSLPEIKNEELSRREK